MPQDKQSPDQASAEKRVDALTDVLMKQKLRASGPKVKGLNFVLNTKKQLGKDAHPDWSEEERLVTAVTQAGLKMAAAAGIDTIGAASAAAVAFIPGVGPILSTAILIGSVVAATQSDKLVVVPLVDAISDSKITDDNIGDLIVKNYRAAKASMQREADILSDIPVYYFDGRSMPAHYLLAKSNRERNQVRFISDAEIREKIASIDLGSPDYRVIPLKSEKRESQLEPLKAVTSDPDEVIEIDEAMDDLALIDDILFELASTDEDDFIPDDIAKLILKKSKPVESYHQELFLKVTHEFVQLANSAEEVVDRNAFAKRAEKLEREIYSDIVPPLHALFSAFLFFNQKAASDIQQKVMNSAAVLKGMHAVISAFSTSGVAALTGDPFAMGVSMIFSGLSGFMSSNDDADRQYAIAILDAIGKMHQDMLDGMRHIMLALGLMDARFMQRLQSIATMLDHQGEKSEVFYNNIRVALGIDRAMLDKVIKSLDRLESRGIKSEIDDAGWRETISSVKRAERMHTDPETLSVSMPASIFNQHLLGLLTTLERVNINGQRRADTDSPLSIDVTSKTLGDKKDHVALVDRNRLGAEQHLHALVDYLKQHYHHLDVVKELPELANIHNPAALQDLASALISLIKTFLKSDRCLGLPAQQVKEAVSTFQQALDGDKQLLTVVKNPELRNALLNDYVKTLGRANSALKDYLASAAKQQHQELALMPMRHRMEIDGQKLSDMTTDIFATGGLDTGNDKDWFGFFENSWWEHAPNGPHWSSYYYNQLRYWPYPSSEIATAKDAHLKNHQNAAEAVKRAVLDRHSRHFTSLKNSIGLSLDFSDIGSIEQEKLFPYYFTGPNNILFPVPNYHLNLIPDAAFLCQRLNDGMLEFTWDFSEAKNTIILKAQLVRKGQVGQDAVILFEQQSTLLPGHGVASPLESVYYAIYGGEVPTNRVYEFDPNLQRETFGTDRDAHNQYAKNGYNGLVSGYRITLYLPRLNPHVGILSDLTNLPVANDGILASWPVTKANPEVLIELQQRARNSLHLIQKEIMNDAVTIIQSGVKSLPKESSIPAQVVTELVEAVDLLDSQAAALRAVLSLSIHPDKINKDTYWPNIIGKNDILKEMDRYQGGAVTPMQFLELVLRTIPQFETTLSRAVRDSGDYYPFMEIQSELQSFYEEEASHQLVVNPLNGDQPLELIDALSNKELYRNKFLSMPASVQSNWLIRNRNEIERLAPMLALPSGATSDRPVISLLADDVPVDNTHDWPTYQCSLNANLTLMQVVIHWVSQWLPWNQERALTEDESNELKTMCEGIYLHAKHHRHLSRGPIKRSIVAEKLDEIDVALHSLDDDIKDILTATFGTDAQVSEIRNKFKNIGERLARLDDIEKKLISYEKEASVCARNGEQLVVCYNRFTDEFTTRVEKTASITTTFTDQLSQRRPIVLSKGLCDLGIFRKPETTPPPAHRNMASIRNAADELNLGPKIDRFMEQWRHDPSLREPAAGKLSRRIERESAGYFDGDKDVSARADNELVGMLKLN